MPNTPCLTSQDVDLPGMPTSLKTVASIVRRFYSRAALSTKFFYRPYSSSDAMGLARPSYVLDLAVDQSWFPRA
jgi:hypothetical protein